MSTIKRDGVALSYRDVGQGSPPILLVHCWGGDHTYLAPQLEHFSKRHRVVAPDLRGFGESDAPEQSYPITAFSDDLAWLCGQLRVRKPVVIGHSMGGTIALDLAARYPELPAAIVILEALVVAPPPLVDGFRPVLAGLGTPAYNDVLAGFNTQLLGPHFDPAERQRIIDRFARNRRHVMLSSLAEVLTYDSAAAAAGCKVPLVYVSSGPWYTDVERFRSLCPQLVTAQALGCGHYFPLEVPDQVHPVIERFLQVYVQGPSASAS